MERTRLDRRGVFSFLSITFVITYAIEGALILSGFRITRLPAMYGQLVVAAVMWVPALSTVLTIRFITREGFAIANIRVGSWKPYVASGLIVPLCFVLIYGLTWLFGLGTPHWELDQYIATLGQAGGAGISKMPPPAMIFPAMFVVTLVVAPFLNGLFGFGEELGWRGYLLPKLMVLGRLRAYVLLGIIWGLWHLPLILIGFTYPGQPVLGIVAFMALTITLGIYINELTLRHRSSILAGWVHGVFNSQKLGIWAVLFPTINPLIGGFAGVVGIVVWLLLGLWEMRRSRAVPAPIQRS